MSALLVNRIYKDLPYRLTLDRFNKWVISVKNFNYLNINTYIHAGRFTYERIENDIIISIDDIKWSSELYYIVILKYKDYILWYNLYHNITILIHPKQSVSDMIRFVNSNKIDIANYIVKMIGK